MKFPSFLIMLGAVSLGQTLDRPRWTAPDGAESRQNPYREKPELAAGGKKLFMKMCASCHASGPGQKGPDLSDQAVQQGNDGAIFWKISTGNSRSGMPSYSSLPEGQRWQLVLYVRSLANRDTH